MRVLFLPHGQRAAYFNQFLALAAQEAGWVIATIGTEPGWKDAKAYVARERFFLVPDWRRMPLQPVDPRFADEIAANELALGIPLNRLLLASERDLGSAFGLGHYHYPRKTEVQRLLKENDRPQKLIAEILRWMGNLIDDFKPDLILAGTAAAPQAFAAMLLARKRGIPFITGRRSKIYSNRSYWTQDPWMFNARAEELCRVSIAAGEQPSDRSIDFIREFREKPRVVGYIAKNWKRLSDQSFLKSHRFFAELAFLHARHQLLRKKSLPPKALLPAVADYYRRALLNFVQKDMFVTFTPEQLKDMKYAYLPLHKEPELAVNFQAPNWHDQFALIAQVSAAIPYGCHLLVREHRGNMGRRPTDYLERLRALPNVHLIDGFDPQFKYLSHAGVVITDNGTSGWEGLIFRRPVLAVARNFYSAVQLDNRVTDPFDLGRVMLKLLRDPPPPVADYDDRLALLADAEWETTMPDDLDGMRRGLQEIAELARAS